MTVESFSCDCGSKTSLHRMYTDVGYSKVLLKVKCLKCGKIWNAVCHVDSYTLAVDAE